METRFGVVIAVKNDGKFLIIRRAQHDSHPGMWEFPGGGVEDKDFSIQHAAIREVMEETGIKAIDIKRLNYNERINGSKTKRYVMFHFLTEALEPNVLLSSDHDLFKWVGRDEILFMKPLLEIGTDSYILLKGIN